MHVQTLEARRLFAVGMVGRELQITGTDGNDVIRVTQVDANTIQVEENGVVTTWADRRVKSIFMNGSTRAVGGVSRNPFGGTAGDDRLEIVDAAVPLTERVRANGGAGNDTLIGSLRGRNIFNGHDGNDSLTGGTVTDTLSGGNGDDVLQGAEGQDVLDGGEGNNVLLGGNGADRMTAGLGADRFDGGAGMDEVSYRGRTAALNITLDDAANDGQLNGAVREGDNVMESVERLLGGAGNDVITAGASDVNNTFFGGAGNDRLDGRGGEDDLDGGAGDDIVTGGSGDDFLSGVEGNDQLSGGDGDDELFGGPGNDALDGDAGDDRLMGSLGADILRGGDGQDYLFARDRQIDVILDGGAGHDIADRDRTDPPGVGIEIFA